MSRTGAHIGLLATVAIWGGAFIAVKAALGTLDWVALTWIRYGAASLLLLGIALAVDAKGLLHLLKERPGRAFATGACGVAAYNLGLNYGESQIPATLSLLIIPVNPVLTLLLARAFLGERAGLRAWMGSALAVAGLSIVVLAARREGEAWGPNPGWGIAATLVAALAWSAYTLLGKSLMAEASPLSATALSTALGTLPVLPLALGRRVDWGGFLSNREALLWMGYLVVLSTVVAFLLYLAGLKALSAGTASMYIYLMPVFGLVWGYAVLRETITLTQGAGALLVAGGVMLASGRKP